MFDGRCRPSPICARCASPAGWARSPASSPRARRSTPARCRVDEALRAHRAALQALPRALRELLGDTHAALRHCGADRLPLDAVDGARRRPAGSARHRARRPLRHQLRRRADRHRPRRCLRPPRLCGQPQQALCRRLHHRALRPARRAASMRCRSRSTARLYMDEREHRQNGSFEYVRADIGHAGNSRRCARHRAMRDAAECSADLQAMRESRSGRPIVQRKRRDQSTIPEQRGPCLSRGEDRDGRTVAAKRKRAARDARRPKSREETPKEGSDNATPIALSRCSKYQAPSNAGIKVCT